MKPSRVSPSPIIPKEGPLPNSNDKSERLRLEGEAGADLVGSLVKLLGIERSTNAEGDALTEVDVVGEGSDTTVVDLGLF